MKTVMRSLALLGFFVLMFLNFPSVTNGGARIDVSDGRALIGPQAGSLYLPVPTRAGEKWLPGLHFSLVDPRALLFDKDAWAHLAPDLSKVEIMDIRLYTSHFGSTDHEAKDKFMADLHAWVQHHSGQVRYVRKPCVYESPHGALQAQMFFTLEQIGRSDLQEVMDTWVREPSRDAIYHNMRNPDPRKFLGLNLIFAKQNGIDLELFKRVYAQKNGDEQIRQVRAVCKAAGQALGGTPMFVINRRFTTSLQRITVLTEERSPERADFDRLLALIKYLVTSEIDMRSTAGMHGN